MKKMTEYIITFSTNLNETMRMNIVAKSYNDGKKKIKKEFSSAHNFR